MIFTSILALQKHSGWAFRSVLTGTAMPPLPQKQSKKQKFACKQFRENSLNIRLRLTSKKNAACHKRMPYVRRFAVC